MENNLSCVTCVKRVFVDSFLHEWTWMITSQFSANLSHIPQIDGYFSSWTMATWFISCQFKANIFCLIPQLNGLVSFIYELWQYDCWFSSKYFLTFTTIRWLFGLPFFLQIKWHLVHIFSFCHKYCMSDIYKLETGLFWFSLQFQRKMPMYS